MTTSGSAISDQQHPRLIHLLYVPTLACNLGCRYCYLGRQTDRPAPLLDADRAVSTLRAALSAFEDAEVLPFNVSLHGGEPTLLPSSVLEELFGIIRRHYLDHYDALTSQGFRKSAPHLKTNLYNFHRLYDLFVRHKVSISASIDLPLALHGRYRTTRAGRSWLPRTLENLRLLAGYPHEKKISCTLYDEHLEDIPAIVADIRRIHDDLGFDMNRFNIMFGFESAHNRASLDCRGLAPLHPAGDSRQIALYHALRDRFLGSDLEEGLKRNWFDEFTPSYCTNALNCGERFMLLQSDGTVWSCVRGQGLDSCRFGNILTDTVPQILAEGRARMAFLHQQAGLAAECRQCTHLHLCHTGCPVVKLQKGQASSYTCALQREIYRDNPRICPPLDPERQKQVEREYRLAIHPALATAESEEPGRAGSPLVLPNDLAETKNSLTGIIAADPVLKELYSDSAFQLVLNSERHLLRSQILRPGRELFSIGPADRVELLVRRDIFMVHCSEPLRNTLFLQMLRDTAVVYGDEQRRKQEHLFSHQLFCQHLKASENLGDQWSELDLMPLLMLHRNLFRQGVLNNLFATTGFLRDYHYQKQRLNAFYHIQAINLPFQNLEFFWDE